MMNDLKKGANAVAADAKIMEQEAASARAAEKAYTLLDSMIDLQTGASTAEIEISDEMFAHLFKA